MSTCNQCRICLRLSIFPSSGHNAASRTRHVDSPFTTTDSHKLSGHRHHIPKSKHSNRNRIPRAGCCDSDKNRTDNSRLQHYRQKRESNQLLDSSCHFLHLRPDDRKMSTQKKARNFDHHHFPRQAVNPAISPVDTGQAGPLQSPIFLIP